MGLLKQYKPVYDGVKHKTPMQRLVEQQQEEKKIKEVPTNGKSDSRKSKSE